MEKKIPKRQCTGCREMKSKKDLIRIIRDTEGKVCLDKTGRTNGRGAYICPNQDCFKKAIRSKAIERSLKIPVPEEVYDSISRELM